MLLGLLASIISSMPIEFLIEFLVIAGGGGGGSGWNSDNGGGGGGAGGYRSSVVGESSGGLSDAEPVLKIIKGETRTITVGAGGPGGLNTDSAASPGNDSVFGEITSIGGGEGGNGLYHTDGGDGGSGGGPCYRNAGVTGTAGLGTEGQGFDGNVNSGQGGPGGGAGGIGGWETPGPGLESSITGTAVTRAVGGKGNDSGSEGAANTGTGGGAMDTGAAGKNGGSGIVIIRYPDSLPDIETIGAGLTYTKTVTGGYKIYEFTAGTDTITF